MNMQDIQAEIADMDLRDLNRQIHSHFMEPYHTNHIYIYIYI